MFDTLIIGAGPAGLTAFYYSLLYGMNACCIGNQIGGKLLLAPSVIDYPGVASFTGKEFIDRLITQIKEVNKEPVLDEVTGVVFAQDVFSVSTKSNTSYQTKTLIIATGNGNKQRENQTEKLTEKLGVQIEKGFIKVGEGMQTSFPAIFAAGECVSYPFSIEQLISSVSTGAQAAAAAYEYVRNEKPPIVWGTSKIKRFI